MSVTPEAPEPLTREEIVADVGDGDATLISRILGAGVSRADFARARAWLAQGEAPPGLDHPTRDALRGLVEMMAAARALSGR